MTVLSRAIIIVNEQKQNYKSYPMKLNFSMAEIKVFYGKNNNFLQFLTNRLQTLQCYNFHSLVL